MSRIELKDEDQEAATKDLARSWGLDHDVAVKA